MPQGGSSSYSLFLSPTFVLRRERRMGHDMLEAAARQHLTELLSTQQGEVPSAPQYGLPGLHQFEDESAAREMKEAIAVVIRTYLPSLEEMFGQLEIDTPKGEQHGRLFRIRFLRSDGEEAMELSTRYVDSRWVVG